MNTILFAFIGMWEAVIILTVVLVLFGAKKLPELARGLGSGIKEFKKATRDVNDELHRVWEEDENPQPQRKLPPAKAETEKPAPQQPPKE